MVVFPSENKTALITGILGFTGHYVAKKLKAKGYRVYGTSQNSEDPINDIFKADISDKDAINKIIREIHPNVVIHLAAISYVDHGDVAEIYHTNVVGTQYLLEAIARLSKPPKIVVLASSANIYGNSPASPITESAISNPQNDYAVSKCAMEQMARLWMDKLPITITRPFNYTGVGQSLNFLIPKIVDHFKREAQKIELGNIDISRDFSDVRVVADCYMKLIEKAPSGEVFNICSNRSTSLREIIETAEDIADYKIQVDINPAFVRSNDIKTLHGSNRKLVDVIGNIDQISLRSTLKWMLKNDSSTSNN